MVFLNLVMVETTASVEGWIHHALMMIWRREVVAGQETPLTPKTGLTAAKLNQIMVLNQQDLSRMLVRR